MTIQKTQIVKLQKYNRDKSWIYFGELVSGRTDPFIKKKIKPFIRVEKSIIPWKVMYKEPGPTVSAPPVFSSLIPHKWTNHQIDDAVPLTYIARTVIGEITEIPRFIENMSFYNIPSLNDIFNDFESGGEVSPTITPYSKNDYAAYSAMSKLYKFFFKDKVELN